MVGYDHSLFEKWYSNDFYLMTLFLFNVRNFVNERIKIL